MPSGESTEDVMAEEKTDGEDYGMAGPLDNEGQESLVSHRVLLDLNAGCPWDGLNYSCAYDVVYMVFYAMYGTSSRAWRTLWTSESPEWNRLLANQFDLLLDNNTSGPHHLQISPQLFATYRNSFRIEVAKSDPQTFPRGRRFAPVGPMLERILGHSVVPYVSQALQCNGCDARSSPIRFSLPYIGFAATLDRLRLDSDPEFIPLSVVLTRFIQRYSIAPLERHRECNACLSARRVESLSLPEASWIWFEQTPNAQWLQPSLAISCRQPPGLKPTHTLAAIIYLGMDHFTARIRKDENTWWAYDSQRRNGTPQVVALANEAELRTFETRLMAYIIYRRCDNGGA